MSISFCVSFFSHHMNFSQWIVFDYSLYILLLKSTWIRLFFNILHILLLCIFFLKVTRLKGNFDIFGYGGVWSWQKLGPYRGSKIYCIKKWDIWKSLQAANKQNLVRLSQWRRCQIVFVFVFGFILKAYFFYQSTVNFSNREFFSLRR